jgi:hypothetical protein
VHKGAHFALGLSAENPRGGKDAGAGQWDGVGTTGSDESASTMARDMKQSVAHSLRGKLLYLLWATYKMAEVGQPRPTALATSMGTTREESPLNVPSLEHARQEKIRKGAVSG